MARFAFVTWPGGGNLPPAIGIAQELVARGHDVEFVGYEVQRQHIEAQNFAFTSLRRSGGFDIHGTPPGAQRLAALVHNMWGCPDHLEDVPGALAEHPAGVLVVDCMMQGALAAASQAEVSTAVLVHSAIAGFEAGNRMPIGAARLAAANGLRARAGLPLMSRLDEGWAGFLTLVTTIPDLDPAAAGSAASVRYVGPIFERFPEQAWVSPWKPDDNRPMVLVSFTTTGMWDQGSRIRNTLDALADQPVRVLVSGAEPSEIGPMPANAAARRFVPHGLVLPSAALTVTHCGHGTLAASLAHGVPVVGLPNPVVDQPFLAGMIQQLGAGLALDGEAPPEAIRAAVRTVLAEPSYAEAARRLSDSIRAAPGAHGAAAELEHLALTGSTMAHTA
jgi:UDP:flavonoid glycosyltransferase YjiC (YdhE family)